MPATVGHILSATTPDDSNYEIRPSHWNSAHAVTLNISGTDISGAFSNANGISFGISANQLTASYTTGAAPNFSAGTTSSALGSVVFSNSNGVGFGLNGSTITASYTVPGATVFSNSNNVSFGLNGSTVTATITVPAQTNQSAGIYASSQTFGQSSSSTHDARSLSIVGSGGVSVGWSNSSLLISGTTYPAQSVQPVAMSAQGGSSAFSTLIFTNSNNVSFSNTGGSVWGSYALNVSATGGTSNALSGLTFQDSNGVSFGLSTGAGVGSLTASVAAQSNQTGGIYFLVNTNGLGNSSSSTYDLRTLSITFLSANLISGAWTNGSLQLGARFKMSAGASSANVASVTFADSNGISFGMSTAALAGTFTASIATTYAGTGFTTGSTTGGYTGTLNTSGLSLVMPYLTRYIWPEGNLTALTAPGNASQSIQYVPVLIPVTGTRLDALIAMSAGSAATSNTAALAFSAYAIIYTRNASTLSSLSSGSTQTTYSYASNSAGQTQLTGSNIYPMSVPINFNLVPGEYFVGFNMVTATSSIGAATTNLGATISMMGGNQNQTALNFAEITQGTATSRGLYQGMGIYSAATTGAVAGVSLSAINQTGSALSAANIALVFRNA